MTARRLACAAAALWLARAGAARADELDMARIRADVRTLSADIGPRPQDTDASRAAADWIERRARENGLAIERMPVGRVVSPEIRVFGRVVAPRVEQTVTDANLVVHIPGRAGGPAILIMGHYDSMPTTPGAVDNAVAVALLLELGRALQAAPPARPVILAWTAAEERRLAGAHGLARDLGRQVGLAISIDLLGAADDVSLNGLSARMGQDWLGWLAAAARDSDTDIHAPVPHRLVSRFIPQAERSDHGAFTERGIPALHIFSRGDQRIYLDYHASGDTVDRVAWPAVDRAGRFLLAITRRSGSLPQAGGPAGMWLPLPGGPRVISTALLVALELALIAAALSGLVPLWRRRARGGPRVGVALGIASSLAIYAVAWLAVAGALRLQRLLTGHPMAWVHAPGRAYAAAIALAAAVAVALAYALARWLRPVGAGRFAAPAIIAPAAVAVTLVILGAPEVALPIALVAAALGAMVWTRRAQLAVALFVVASLPLGYLLTPALVRELVFNGGATMPAVLPLAPAMAVLLAAHAFAAVYLWRRFGRPLPGGGRGAALVLGTCAAVAAIAVTVLIGPVPQCTGARYQLQGLYCERYRE